MSTDWLPTSLNPTKPVYRAIADAIEADIASSRLQNGDKLPTQRHLAKELNVDFTTITRAYGEARKRGLIVARVGQGTFIQGSKAAPSPTTRQSTNAEIDMGMNMPPVPTDPDVITRMHHEMNEVTHRLSTRSLFGYQDFIGSPMEREQAAHWVSRFLPKACAERLLICSGTQSALLSLVLFLLKPGDTAASENVTYPGFSILLRQLGIHHVGLEMDDEGIIPAVFRKACQEKNISVLYCNPTLHNPTTTTWSQPRRVAIAQIAREYDVKIIEDDAYGGLALSAPAPLSTFAPERSYYIIGLAKCLSSALRISFLCVPDHQNFQALALSNRATSMMASPITKAMALQLLSSGCADLVVKDILKEVTIRQKIAKDILPKGSFKADPNGFQVWLELGEHWTTHEFMGNLRRQGIRLIGGDAFAVSSNPPNAVRICLGVPETSQKTNEVLSTITNTLRYSTNELNAIV
ncbi:Transcriptional regulator, GntR family with aminotransferase domain protein [Candidatus Terasakiella magnetica]|uniref:Transcriptional regulator, GntR family with aminotransferase domain protein n=1 Tax=Candidatus Terasakiella magnetica TaxID=1867952 RepID=A0A1C3RL20_9PROT|nr:PLP-dependent aminotransferase family protein [Candidatus Terasakiella magnetica]SCA57958.1 Transcriptional regulator, GntR family with aminotransferase domain protein [Candidatus Terasakiella magnetica]